MRLRKGPFLFPFFRPVAVPLLTDTIALMSEPRVVFLDLETLPNLRQALHVWPQLSNFPGRTLKASINSIICFGYKVLGESEARTISAWDFPEWDTDVNNDVPLLKEALKVLEGADAIITQNGKSFDEKVLQTRLLLNGLPGLPNLSHVDTKLLAKRYSFFSNSLKYLAEQLTPETPKQDNEGWNLWVRVYDREEDACLIMEEYCRNDVLALEAIYKRLRPAARGANSLPNYNLFTVGGSGKNLCPHCGSTRIKSEGIRSTKTRTYRRYVCHDCKAWSHTDINDRLPRAL